MITSYIGAQMTDSMITYTASKWVLNYPDTTMTTGTTYSGVSMEARSSAIYNLFSSSTSTYAWLPSICPDGKYQGSTPSVTAYTAIIRSGTATYAEWLSTTGQAELDAWTASLTTVTSTTTPTVEGAVFLRWKTITSLMIAFAIF